MNPRQKNNKLTLLKHCVLLSLLTSLVGGCAVLPSAKQSADSETAAAANTNPLDATANKAKGLRTASKTPTDLWERIRDGLHLPPLDNALIARHEQWFANNPEYIENMVDRAQLYLYHIVEEVEKRGMPMEIALLPAIESAYKPQAYSRARAAGLWQFIPSTGRLYGLESNWWYDGRRDVVASTQAALDYLQKLNKDFKGDWQLTLAAYNCGEGRVMRLMEKNRRRGLSTAYSDLPLPRETRHYVPKLMAIVNIISDPAKYGLQLASIPNEEYFTRVETGSQIDLGVAARLADLSVAELYMINPAYSRWITDPDGPHHLLVPTDKKEQLLAGLSSLPEEDRVQWTHHRVQRGNTLSEIARRYQVSVEAIKSANRLNSNLLSLGQGLLIPISPSKLASASIKPPGRLAASAAPKSGKQRVVYRVRSGDTLWSIAKRYNVYVEQLRQWNLLDVNDILKLGQKLHIWTQTGPSAALDDQNPA